MTEVDSYPCPCCGYLSFAEPPGSYEICPICFWEDDAIQLRWPHWTGGANGPSLIEAQEIYTRLGAMEERLLRFVRPPTGDDAREPGWRPIDPEVDHFEPVGESLREWPSDTTDLYWWRPTYWRPREP